MPRKHGKRKKTRTHQLIEEKTEGGVGEGLNEKEIPRSIVARANDVSANVKALILDIRKLMSPFTALNLKERSYNRIKDYSSVATALGITHLFAVSETNSNIILKLARFHNGPTLNFRIQRYTLSKQIRESQKRPYDSHAAFNNAPLIVLNNFGQSQQPHIALLKTTLNNIFPAINVKTIRLNECRRVVLFQFSPDTELVEMRHYAVLAVPVGVSRSVKKIIKAKLPNLADVEDISEYMEGKGLGPASDSEGEDETAKIELSENFLRNQQSQKSAIKLVEIGPRLTLELFKVEHGLCEGDILYHKFVEKTPEEAAAIKARVDREKAIKRQRKVEQEENVKRKKSERDEKLKVRAEKKRVKLEKRQERGNESESGEEDDDQASNDDNDFEQNVSDEE